MACVKGVGVIWRRLTVARTPGSRELFSRAGELRRELIDDRLLDELLASVSERGIALTGEGGLFPELVRVVQGTRDAG